MDCECKTNPNNVAQVGSKNVVYVSFGRITFVPEMTKREFFTRLLWLTASLSAFMALLHWLVTPLAPHVSITVVSVLFFTAVCTGLFFAADNALRSSSKAAFNGVMLGSVFGKMLLSVAVLLLYKQSVQPTDQWFVGIFLLIYVVYTVFEVQFMTRLVKGA